MRKLSLLEVQLGHFGAIVYSYFHTPYSQESSCIYFADNTKQLLIGTVHLLIVFSSKYEFCHFRRKSSIVSTLLFHQNWLLILRVEKHSCSERASNCEYAVQYFSFIGICIIRYQIRNREVLQQLPPRMQRQNDLGGCLKNLLFSKTTILLNSMQT